MRSWMVHATWCRDVRFAQTGGWRCNRCRPTCIYLFMFTFLDMFTGLHLVVMKVHGWHINTHTHMNDMSRCLGHASTHARISSGRLPCRSTCAHNGNCVGIRRDETMMRLAQLNKGRSFGSHASPTDSAHSPKMFTLRVFTCFHHIPIGYIGWVWGEAMHCPWVV